MHIDITILCAHMIKLLIIKHVFVFNAFCLDHEAISMKIYGSYHMMKCGIVSYKNLSLMYLKQVIVNFGYDFL